MSVDCVLAEEETPRDVAIRETIGYETEHLELSPAQDGERRGPDSRRSRRWNDAQDPQHGQRSNTVPPPPPRPHRRTAGLGAAAQARGRRAPGDAAPHRGEVAADARSPEPSVARGEE